MSAGPLCRLARAAARIACLAVWVCLIAAAPAAHAQGASEPAFSGRRGIGGFKTFQFPVRSKANPALFAADPYVPSWRVEMLGGRLEELKRAGFDFLRINVRPDPLLVAKTDEFAKLIGEIDFAVRSSLRAGLKVLLDIHVSEEDPVWGAHQVTAGYDRIAFQRYLEIVASLARLLEPHEPSAVALELFNEPPSPCAWSGRPPWPEQLARIHAHARGAAPRLTLVVAGACYAKIDGLQLLDGVKFDANTMFTVHYYEPHIFSHQGYWGAADKFLQHLAPLPYPATAAQLPATLERIEQAIRGSSKIGPESRQAEWLKAKRRVTEYFAEFSDRKHVRTRLASVRAWADRHKVSPRRILIGEFGVMKDIYGYTGARPEDRTRWLGDVREAAEEQGFAWAAWALTNTMGIVKGDTDGPLDPGVLRALGLRRP